MHILHRSIVGNNGRVFADYGNQGVAVPAVLSRALPIVGNSESESPRYATLDRRLSSGRCGGTSGLGDMLVERQGFGGTRALWTALDLARARFSFAARRPPETRDAPEFHAMDGGTRSTPVSSMLNEKPVPCSASPVPRSPVPGMSLQCA